MATAAISRPRSVRVAVAILCAALLYALVTGVLRVALTVAVPPIITKNMAYAFGVAGVCINAFFVYKIFKGRNWARIVYLVFYVLGIWFIVHSFAELFGRSPTWAVLGLIAYAAHIVALVLLFTRSSNEWFKPQSA